MTREETISIMNVIVHMLEPQYDTDRIEDAVETAIKALKQEPKTGHWRPVTQGDEVISYRCSCCGYSSKNNYEWKFCPNCGADMRGEEK